jgi:tetratricopeptide (TPR) repeat protein
MTAYVLGSWDAALADYESAEARMREVGVAWVSAYTLIGLGQLHLARGDAASGSRLLEGAVELSNHSGDLQALRWAQTALAEWDILADRPGAARHRLEPLLDRPGQQEGLVTYLLPYLAWACARTGDDDAAQRYLQMCVERAEAEQIHLALVDALRVRALLSLDGVYAHGADATSDLQRAIELSSAMPYPYAEAKARYVLGLLCRAGGDVDSASTQWEQASIVLRQLGERLYATRVEDAQAPGGG